MDSLFIPGATRAEILGRKVISQRPNTKLITLPKVFGPHVEGLLKFLRKPPFTPPIGDLILVAHGHYFGAYEMPIDHKHGSPTQFEELVEADLGDSIRLIAADLEQTDGSTSKITVHLRGCNIGVARPFVERFQKAMTPTGGTLNMTAPLHFDEFSPVTGGYVEYLAYDFRLTSPTPFKDQAAVINAFDQRSPKFQFINGQDVPLAFWKAWIPADIHPKSDQSFPYYVDVSPAIGSVKTAKLNREYRYEKIPFNWDWGVPDPGTQPERLKILHDTLPQGTDKQNNHIYDPDYDYPMYKRYGFTDLDDYVNNLVWKVTSSKKGLHFHTERHEYTVMVPIADAIAPSTTPTLTFYTFYPSTSKSPAFVNLLDESNASLFLSL
jgi:hypothetical protein